MTKMTVYLNKFARKMWIQIAICEAVCLLKSLLLERSDDLSMIHRNLKTFSKAKVFRVS